MQQMKEPQQCQIYFCGGCYSHVTELAKTEKVSTVSRVIEGERRVGVDRHGKSVGGRVHLLTSVQLEGIEVGSVLRHF